MKRNYPISLIALLLLTICFQFHSVKAQSPNQFKYQAVLREASGNIISNQQKTIVINILQGEENGASVFTENHNVTTSGQGIINLNIGSINPTGLAAIDWSSATYFIKISVDGIDMGTSQILSVPYALVAKTVSSFDYLKLTNKPILFTGSYNDLTNKPTLFDGSWQSLSGKPSLASVATTGNYNDLTDKPAGNHFGAVQYWNGNVWVNVEQGLPGQYLQLSASNIPTWSGPTYPSIITASISSITSSTATGGGNITNDGGATVISRGICWNTSTNPTILNYKVISGNGVGSFISYLSGLTAETTYYVRAFATNSVGTTYGNEVSFKTDIAPVLPSLTTNIATNITSNSATLGGNITSDGNATVTERGVCYSISPNPTTANTKLVIGSGTGSFTQSASGLTSNTTYYMRAYAINSQGTAYGNEVNFKTNIELSLATLTTSAPTNITTTGATLGGNITSDGNATVTERGICYSTSPNPTTANTKLLIGSGTGSFSQAVTGLTANTTYYVRAYAINSQGTAYGNQQTFTTNLELSLAVLTTSTPTNITTTGATLGGNITSDGNATVTERGVCYSTSPNPTISNTKLVVGSGTGTFSVSVSGLNANTTYYARTYAINSVGLSYGNEINWSTLNTPIVETLAISFVNGTSAKSGGLIINTGGSIISSQGLCWSTSPAPTILNNKTTSFTSDITQLIPGTLYYLRAYATNVNGTGYGNEIIFNSGYAIGSTFAGGIVFYNELGTGHGLVCAPHDQGSGSWGCDNISIIGTSTAFGSGAKNTQLIIEKCSVGAAKICYDLVLNGFDDWYLPSLTELSIMKRDLFKTGLGYYNNYLGGYYWSSSLPIGDGDHDVWCDVVMGNPSTTPRITVNTSAFNIRAIRSF